MYSSLLNIMKHKHKLSLNRFLFSYRTTYIQNMHWSALSIISLQKKTGLRELVLYILNATLYIKANIHMGRHDVSLLHNLSRFSIWKNIILNKQLERKWKRLARGNTWYCHLLPVSFLFWRGYILHIIRENSICW